MSTHTARDRVPVWTKADRLRKARETTGMDQREFADAVGISKNTVSNYETGKSTRISRPMLAAWAMATGVPLEWLETGEEPSSGPDPDGELDPLVGRRHFSEQSTDGLDVQVRPLLVAA